MKQVVGIVVSAIVLAGLGIGVHAAAPAAEAAGCISLTRISFDSPGADSGSNTSRNAEWVQLYNACAGSRSLNGWTLRDRSGHVYHFGTYSLPGYGYVKVHTGKGTDTSGHRYWGSRDYIWNNDGDKAILKNAAKTVVDTCRYSGAGSATSC